MRWASALQRGQDGRASVPSLRKVGNPPKFLVTTFFSSLHDYKEKTLKQGKVDKVVIQGWFQIIGVFGGKKTSGLQLCPPSWPFSL